MIKKIKNWIKIKINFFIQTKITEFAILLDPKLNERQEESRKYTDDSIQEYSKLVDLSLEKCIKQMNFYHSDNQKYCDSRINGLQDSIDDFDKDIHQHFNNQLSRLQNQLNIVSKELEELKLIEANRKAKLAIKESDKPWVDWCGDEIDENGMIKLKLDWNQPMIKLLQENGYQGTDEQIIQKWLYLTLQEVATEEANNIPKFNQ